MSEIRIEDLTYVRDAWLNTATGYLRRETLWVDGVKWEITQRVQVGSDRIPQVTVNVVPRPNVVECRE